MASSFTSTSPSFDSNNVGQPAAPTSSDAYLDDSRLTPLEASILSEYARLRQNLDNLSRSLGDLAAVPSGTISDGLRTLERKTALVCTALKSSVYGIVLQQQIEGLDGGGDERPWERQL